MTPCIQNNSVFYILNESLRVFFFSCYLLDMLTNAFVGLSKANHLKFHKI